MLSLPQQDDVDVLYPLNVIAGFVLLFTPNAKKKKDGRTHLIKLRSGVTVKHEGPDFSERTSDAST